MGQCNSHRLLRVHLLLVLRVALPLLDRCHLSGVTGSLFPTPSLPGGALQSDPSCVGKLARRGQQSTPLCVPARILCAFPSRLRQWGF